MLETESPQKKATATEKAAVDRELYVQGISKRLFPGVFLPAEGKQNATFSTDFTQPGKRLLEIPCTPSTTLSLFPSFLVGTPSAANCTF